MEELENECLNIQEHTRLLVITALNRYKKIYEAMQALGINHIRMRNYRNHFNLVKIDDQWVERPKQIKRIS